MGSGNSKTCHLQSKDGSGGSDGLEQVYHNPKSQVQLQPTLIEELAGISDGPPSALRQAQLDSSIQHKLQADLARLKKMEQEVDSKVREAFNQQSSSKTAQTDGNAKSSVQLMEELSKVREKVHQHRSKNNTELLPEITKARDEVTACLQQNQRQPLNCTEEVENFTRVARNFESKFVISMQ
ncbi:hypothetical protein O181_053806 [Austropuccinia psidii MF-1]|uniref:Uncharacterized protein n=1 Tax=Austropuccinia psidii MF-1 TaxID=1389203 RepID=A0A9Q3HQI6_9BASI|nr:hypothetical protein [Austropuccinia psidii MF-1]